MAIQIKTHPTDEDLTGRSHWWGAPDMPEDMPIPYVTIEDGIEIYDEPFTFVCQIRLEDIAELDKEGLLPHKGMLYFFAPIAYFLGDNMTSLDEHMAPVVLYTEQETGLKPYDLHWEDSGESVFRPAEAITFSLMEEAEGDGHILLGKPYQDEIADAHPDCISLLQIDEDDDWNLRFYDCGMYYFLIPESALKSRDWTKVIGDLFFY